MQNAMWTVVGGKTFRALKAPRAMGRPMEIGGMLAAHRTAPTPMQWNQHVRESMGPTVEVERRSRNGLKL